MYILGIESSCDETSAALLSDGKIVANRIYSQKAHAAFGGVVPEIASRAHMRKIDHLCEAVLRDANIGLDEIALIAVADQPGLAGALLVGISFALGIAEGNGIEATGVNHLEGHIASASLENEIAFPYLALVVSGGHTAIYRVDNWGDYTPLGQTIDDAAGEAFDKIGKMIGLAYPAGRPIEETAARFDRSVPLIDFPVAKLDGHELDFSFSGLKTSVKYFLEKQPSGWIEENKPLVCASVQNAIVSALVRNTALAAQQTGIRTVVVVGGVACNGALRDAMKKSVGESVIFPAPALCTDNAAMIARAGWENWKIGNGRFPSMRPTQPRGPVKKENV